MTRLRQLWSRTAASPAGPKDVDRELGDQAERRGKDERVVERHEVGEGLRGVVTTHEAPTRRRTR
ncbi:hypothetical protein Sar04_27680 [Salinispora arenicola]|uniref:Uncharacterized protein n=1 Tax=Salinispora arenicola TaxID=168697 RepID=A0ABQ4JTH4_SALAC|nr:hypothetical protein Sar04_27680 [Salinispora arenicola]